MGGKTEERKEAFSTGYTCIMVGRLSKLLVQSNSVRALSNLYNANIQIYTSLGAHATARGARAPGAQCYLYLVPTAKPWA